MVFELPPLKIGHYLFNDYYMLVESFIQERPIRAQFIIVIVKGFHIQRKLTWRCEIPTQNGENAVPGAQSCKSDLIKAIQMSIRLREKLSVRGGSGVPSIQEGLVK